MQTNHTCCCCAVVFVIVWSLPTVAQDADARPEQLFQKLDTNKDGSLTADEISDEQRKHFDRLITIGDEDENQILTRDEFLKALAPETTTDNDFRVDDARRPRFDVNQFFKNHDQNKDGKLTSSELPEQTPPSIRGIFQRAGKDGLTQADFTKLTRRSMGGSKRTPSPSKDTNRPNPEALQRAEEFFERLDVNGDGKATVAEAPEKTKRILESILKRSGRETNNVLTKSEFLRILVPGSRQQRRPEDTVRSRTSGRRDEPDRTQRTRSPSKDTNRPNSEAVLASPRAEEFFERLDVNGDGKATVAEAPERTKRILGSILKRSGRETNDVLTKSEFLRILVPGSRQQRRPEDTVRSQTSERRDKPDRTQGDQPDQPRPDERGFGGPLFFRKLDSNQDGKLSKAEFARAGEIFGELDRNQDATLDPQELFGPPPEGRGFPGPSFGRPSDRPSRSGMGPDTRGDQSRPPFRERSSDRNTRRRPDDSNTADRPENKADHKLQGRIFARMDKDGNQKISRAEATTQIKANFSDFDKNSDGGIDQSELSEAIAGIRARR